MTHACHMVAFRKMWEGGGAIFIHYYNYALRLIPDCGSSCWAAHDLLGYRRHCPCYSAADTRDLLTRPLAADNLAQLPRDRRHPQALSALSWVDKPSRPANVPARLSRYYQREHETAQIPIAELPAPATPGLRACRERPRCRATNERDELTSPHIRTQARGTALYRLP
jgi:hypothetical protein